MTTEIYLASTEANKNIEELNQEIIELKHKAQQIDVIYVKGHCVKIVEEK
jgi:hypothetical protein